MEYSELLSQGEPIPATVANLKIIMEHLNGQNWGAWDLPALTVGYTANQYEGPNGRNVTALKLDEPILTTAGPVALFKCGPGRRILPKYTAVENLSDAGEK